MKKALSVTLTLVIALLTVALAFTGCGEAKTPQEAAIRYLNACMNMDIETQAALNYRASFQKKTDKSEYIKFWKENNEQIKTDNPEYYQSMVDQMGSYTLVEVLSETKKEPEELQSELKNRSNEFRDTDKVTDKERIVFSASKDGGEPTEYSYIMYCVDGSWYIGDIDMW